MDKRTVLAFVLIAIIFIVWQLWYVKTAPPPKPAPQAIDSLAVDSLVSAPPRAEPIAQQAVGQDTLIVAIDTIPEQKIQVTTNRYHALFSNKGGGLVKLELKDYRYSDSGSVQLLPDQARAVPSLISLISGFSDRDLTYIPDKTEIDLSRGNLVDTIRFQADFPMGGVIVKEYVLYADSFNVDLYVNVAGIPTGKLEREYILSWNEPIPPSERNLDDDYSNYKGVVYLSGSVEKIDSFDKNNLMNLTLTGNADWVGSRSKYFGYCLIPKDALSNGAHFEGRKTDVTTPDGKFSQRTIAAGLVMPMKLTSSINDRFTIFAGPLDYRILKRYGRNLQDMIDWGWKIIEPFSVAIYWVSYQLHRLVPNYGIVIIVLSILLKVITYPLTKKQLKSMQAMQRLAPKIEELKAKYKDNPQKMNQMVMKMYKEEKVNPMGGCLLMLPQMPLLFGLYQVFRSTFEFRQAYFIFYWPDLSQPDPVPYVMVIIMCAAMFIQQKLTTKDPKQKMLVYLMPIMMFVFFRGLPVGLVLYWTSYNILSIIETLTVRKPLRLPATQQVVGK